MSTLEDLIPEAMVKEMQDLRDAVEKLLENHDPAVVMATLTTVVHKQLAKHGFTPRHFMMSLTIEPMIQAAEAAGG